LILSNTSKNPSHASLQLEAAQRQLCNTLLLIIRSARGTESVQIKHAQNKIFELNISSDIRAALANASGNALLELATVRHIIYVTAAQNDSIALWRALKLISQLSVDLTLAALSSMAEVWDFDTEHMSSLVEAYLQVIENTESGEVRAVAVTYLADLLDKSFDGTEITKGVLWDIQNIPDMLQQTRLSPKLANAQLRISGWVLLTDVIFDSETRPSSRFEAWGYMINEAGAASNVSFLPGTCRFRLIPAGLR